jgi:hypothetical protein
MNLGGVSGSADVFYGIIQFLQYAISRPHLPQPKSILTFHNHLPISSNTITHKTTIINYLRINMNKFIIYMAIYRALIVICFAIAIL